MKERIEKKNGSTTTVMRRNRVIVSALVVVILLTCVMPVMAFATGAGIDSGDAIWTAFVEIVLKWVRRVAGLVMLVGAIMFGFGWKSQDAEQKQNGLNTLAAGGIVLAVAAAAPMFIV